MSKHTFKGSCQCGRVRFEAGLDFSQGTSKCNCTRCWKKRWWSIRCAQEDFRSIEGEEELVKDSQLATTGPGGFCRHCGVRPYSCVDASEWNPVRYFSINVAALDEVDPALIVAAPVTYCDGLHDNWWNAPAEVRHL